MCLTEPEISVTRVSRTGVRFTCAPPTAGKNGGVAELVDAVDLKSTGETRVSSNLTIPTIR